MLLKDRQILRDMAKTQVEIAHSDTMAKLRADWKLHGDLGTSSRPMITMELGTFAKDIIPPLMRCEGEEARKIEWEMHSNVVNHTLFDDDTLVKNYIPVRYSDFFIPFGIECKMVHATDGIAHHFVAQIKDLKKDFHILKKSTFGIDKTSALQSIQDKNELFGDILPAKLSGISMAMFPTYDIVRFMSMEDLFMSMYDYPDLFKKMMTMLTNDYLEFMDLKEKEDFLLPTYDECELNWGSYCFNDILPHDGNNLKTTDVWGYMNSQETSGVSPAMYEEFIAPYYKTISDRFGLFSYGCCEPVDPIWHNFLSTLTNLRKLSISPWCNEEFMGEVLQSKKIIYNRKPSPNLLGFGSELDEKAVRAHIEKTVHAAMGCTLEITQRDVYRLHNTSAKVKRYVELIRKECEKHKK